MGLFKRTDRKWLVGHRQKWRLNLKSVVGVQFQLWFSIRTISWNEYCTEMSWDSDCICNLMNVILIWLTFPAFSNFCGRVWLWISTKILVCSTKAKSYDDWKSSRPVYWSPFLNHNRPLLGRTSRCARFPQFDKNRTPTPTSLLSVRKNSWLSLPPSLSHSYRSPHLILLILLGFTE